MEVLTVSNQYNGTANSLLGGSPSTTDSFANQLYTQNYCCSCDTWYYGYHHCSRHVRTVVVPSTATEAQLLKAWIDGFLAAGGKLTEAKLRKIQKKLENFSA